jgi:hypothetical protein
VAISESVKYETASQEDVKLLSYNYKDPGTIGKPINISLLSHLRSIIWRIFYITVYVEEPIVCINLNEINRFM